MKKLKLTRDWPNPLPPRDPNYVRDFPLTTLEAQEMAKKKAAKSATPAAATAMKDAGDPTKNDPAQPPLLSGEVS